MEGFERKPYKYHEKNHNFKSHSYIFFFFETVLFPANALAVGKDILSVSLTTLKLELGELHHEYIFQLLESKETMPDDSSRSTYELYTPNSMKINYL